MTRENVTEILTGRRWLLLALLLLAGAGLVWRALYLQVWDNSFLQNQGDARHLRVMELVAHRGNILDRNGEPLAISTPVDSVWVNPPLFLQEVSDGESARLAELLGMDPRELRRRVGERDEREFVYLKRHVSPELAARVKALGLAGVSLQREFRRYYPLAEVAGHVVGFTDIDDEGQEGIELVSNDVLRGVNGSMRVLKNRLGEVVEHVEHISDAQPGKDIVLSLDKRVQYLAYRELKAAVQAHEAVAASAVLLDTQSGEVLAMVNQPSYNPNNRASLKGGYYRNRAVTDVFEPGSTMKPFTVAVAMEAGKIKPNTVIDTAPGYYRLGSNTIRDAVNYGSIDVTTVLQKSSNIGISKIALSISAEQLWKGFARFGFGMGTESRFPGEADGSMGDYWRWKQFQQASRSYGYGISVTALQLARAYSILANDGVMKPISFFRRDTQPAGEPVLAPEVAREVRTMLESVVNPKGTGKAARVQGYRIAGKTGTAHRLSRKGYADDRYSALFAGIAPASKPRLVLVVVVHDPKGGAYHGGAVAAPVFSRIMGGALRLLNIQPDNLEGMQLRHAYNQDPESRLVAWGGQ